MKNLSSLIILISAIAAVVLSGGCYMHDDELARDNDALPVTYPMLYGCLWTVADLTENTEDIPCQIADSQGALLFQESGNVMYILCKKTDAVENSSLKNTYTVVAQCSYGIDCESGTITVTGEEMDCFFQIERLNDRTMTLYYNYDCNEYVAYSRCQVSSVSIVK